MLRRFIPFLIVASVSISFLFAVFNISWRSVPQAVGLGDVVAVGPSPEELASGMNIKPDLRTKPKPVKDAPAGSQGFKEVTETWKSGHGGGFKEPKVESTSPYPVGQLKPVGSNYTKILVAAKMTREDTTWIDRELGDLTESGLLRQAIYVVDDPKAPYHPPRNKGHEVMVYLTYIIDHYDALPDVSIFVHGHRHAWHNNELHDGDMAQMIRHLSAERVTRDGYMNLRCHWDPGCPNWLHPGATVPNYDKPEEWLIAEAWVTLFPLDPIPTILAQPCCGQFAVSRDRIRALARDRYLVLRGWLLHTELSDYLSGRVFEYVWQYIFTAAPIHCPSMSACYCDGYGLCFGSPESFDRWFELRYRYNELARELKAWESQADRIEMLRLESVDGQVREEADIEVPEPGRGAYLRHQTAELKKEMDHLRAEARVRGRDPRQRALESGREWKEGDGF